MKIGVAIPFDPGQVSTQIKIIKHQAVKFFVSQSLLIQGRFQLGVKKMSKKGIIEAVAIPFDPGQVSTNVIALFFGTRHFFQSQSLLIQGRFQPDNWEWEDRNIGSVAIPFDPGQVSTNWGSGFLIYQMKFKSQSLLIQGRFQQMNTEKKLFYLQVAIPFDPGQVSTFLTYQKKIFLMKKSRNPF